MADFIIGISAMAFLLAIPIIIVLLLKRKEK